MARSPRAGVSVTEILVAVAILAAGMIPIFNIYRGARVGIGISRDLVELQEEAHGLMTAAKLRLRTGQVLAHEIDGDMVTEVTNGELSSRVTLSPSLFAGRLLTIRVRTERHDRFYEAYQVVSDPFGVIHVAGEEEDG